MSVKLKIVMVIPSLQSGGAEKVFTTLANGFANLGYFVNAITFDSNPEQDFFKLDSNVFRQHLDVLEASRGPVSAIVNNVYRAKKLRGRLKKLTPDVVISFLTETNIVTLLATVNLRLSTFKSTLPTIICEHTNPKLCPLSFSWSALRNITYRRCSSLVVLSPEMTDFYPSKVQARTHILPNPIELPIVERLYDRSAPIDSIVSVGRLSEEKNHRLMIQAFASIASEYSELKLRLIGDGPLRPTLEEQCKELGVKNRVEFTGISAAPWKLVTQENSIFVLSSNFEGFPMALCEAMSVGLPVITTEYHAGVKDIIDNGVNGRLVPVGSEESLVQQIKSLLNNPDERTRIAKNAMNIVTKFGKEEILKRWQSLIADTIAHG